MVCIERQGLEEVCLEFAYCSSDLYKKKLRQAGRKAGEHPLVKAKWQKDGWLFQGNE